MTALFSSSQVPPASIYPLVMRLRYILETQKREVLLRLPAAVRDGSEITLDHWVKPMLEMLRHAMAPYWQAGLLRGRRELERVLTGRPETIAPKIVQRSYSKVLLRQRRKDFALSVMSPNTFSLHNPLVLEAIDRATMIFCQVTNDTSTTDLNTAIARLRVELNEGIERGEAFSDLAERVRTLFDTPRANTIAVTETSRALNGGSLIAYEKAQCEGSMWLCTSNPCPKICEPLDYEERPFGVPFWVNPKGGPYAVVLHAPAHPRCFCVNSPVLAL